MKKQVIWTKCAFVVIILGFLLFLSGILFTFPLEGFMKWLSPFFTGIIGLILSTIGFVRSRTKISIALMIASVIQILWPWIFMMGGTLLFGP